MKAALEIDRNLDPVVRQRPARHHGAADVGKWGQATFSNLLEKVA